MSFHSHILAQQSFLSFAVLAKHVNQYTFHINSHKSAWDIICEVHDN